MTENRRLKQRPFCICFYPSLHDRTFKHEADKSPQCKLCTEDRYCFFMEKKIPLSYTDLTDLMSGDWKPPTHVGAGDRSTLVLRKLNIGSELNYSYN